MQMFVIINNIRIMINADVNAKNWSTKEYGNPSYCEYKSDKLRDVGEYLNYANCKCRKRLIDRLVEECSKNFDEKELHSNQLIYNGTSNDYKKVCNFCSVYIVLIFFVT